MRYADLTTARRYARAMKRHRLLRGWVVNVVEGVPKTRAAYITYDRKARTALIELHPQWRKRTDLSLRKLVAHEVAHLAAPESLDRLSLNWEMAHAEEEMVTLVGSLIMESVSKRL